MQIVAGQITVAELSTMAEATFGDLVKAVADVRLGWIAPFYYECAGPPVGADRLDYPGTVIAAYNAAGHSIFAIADPGGWWRAAPDEVIC